MSVDHFVEGHCYTRKQIGRVIDGDTQQAGLPTKNGRVTCAILGKDRNVAPPDVILVGTSRDRARRGKALCDYPDDQIPVFVTEGETTGEGAHRYCGLYSVSHVSEDPHTLPLWSQAARNREDNVKQAIFLRKCS